MPQQTTTDTEKVDAIIHNDPLYLRGRKEGITAGIKMERQRVTALLLAQDYKRVPGEDCAMVIANGIHWAELP